jgi:hypothetical protein
MTNTVISDLFDFLETKIEIDNYFIKIVDEFKINRKENEYMNISSIDNKLYVIDDLINFIENIDDDNLASYICICEDYKNILKDKNRIRIIYEELDAKDKWTYVVKELNSYSFTPPGDKFPMGGYMFQKAQYDFCEQM